MPGPGASGPIAAPIQFAGISSEFVCHKRASRRGGCRKPALAQPGSTGKEDVKHAGAPTAIHAGAFAREPD